MKEPKKLPSTSVFHMERACPRLSIEDCQFTTFKTKNTMKGKAKRIRPN
jgi:hypothetical protein